MNNILIKLGIVALIILINLIFRKKVKDPTKLIIDDAYKKTLKKGKQEAYRALRECRVLLTHRVVLKQYFFETNLLSYYIMEEEDNMPYSLTKMSAAFYEKLSNKIHKK